MSEKKYKTEAEMCEHFSELARKAGWTAYPETHGWDLLIVRDGLQVGIQAKLNFNATLLRQVLPDQYWERESPQVRSVLLPKTSIDMRSVFKWCGIHLFSMDEIYSIENSLRDAEFEAVDYSFRQSEMPEYVPDVAAGASSPVQLTPFKIGAMKVLAWMDVQKHLKRCDFNRGSQKPSVWVQNMWVLPDKESARNRCGRDVFDRFLPGPKRPRFPEQHPQVWPQILGETRKQIEQMNGTT